MVQLVGRTFQAGRPEAQQGLVTKALVSKGFVHIRREILAVESPSRLRPIDLFPIGVHGIELRHDLAEQCAKRHVRWKGKTQCGAETEVIFPMHIGEPVAVEVFFPVPHFAVVVIQSDDSHRILPNLFADRHREIA